MAEKSNLAKNDINSNANDIKSGAKNVSDTAKASSKLATGNYAGAAKDFLKNPSGILKAFLAFLLVVCFVFSMLVNSVYDYFFGENTYSAVSDFVQMQSDFRKDSLSKSYSYLKNEIYKDIITKMNKEKINNDKDLEEGLKEIFSDQSTLEDFINKACINLSNPTRVGKKYEDYANIENGDERYFALLEGKQNGRNPQYDRTSTSGQTTWDRCLQIIDFNNDGNKDIKTTDKALYTLQYNNGKFYDNSESVSMYKALFDSFFDATLTYANTKRLQQTNLLVTDKNAEGYSDSLAFLNEQISAFIKNKSYKNYNYKESIENSDKLSGVNGIITSITVAADKLIDTYLGVGSSYEDYYVYYPCEKYRDAMLTTMSRLDSFLKDYGAEDLAVYYSKVDGTPSTLPSDNVVGKGGSLLNDEGKIEELSDLSVNIDTDDEELENLNALQDEKTELFIEFYSDPIFYKNLFTYNVSVLNNDNNNETSYLLKKRNSILDAETKTDAIAAQTINNIKVNRIINIDIDTCSPQTLIQIYEQYFYTNFLSKDVKTEDWGEIISNINKGENGIDQNDYLKAIMLYFSGEETDDTSNSYKDIPFLNSPNLKDGENVTTKSFDDTFLVAENAKNNELIIPSYVLTESDKTNDDKKINTSDAYFSNYLSFKTTNKDDYYTSENRINQTILFPSKFSNEFTEIINSNKAKNANWTLGKLNQITAVVSVGDFELNRNITDSNFSFFATKGSENYASLTVSGSLDVVYTDGTSEHIECNNITPEVNSGKAMLIFEYNNDKTIASVKCLSTNISPKEKDAAIKNVTYSVGSVTDSFVNMLTLNEIYEIYLDAGIVNSAVLTEAGYVVANIYIQYKTDMFSVLFNSLEIESTKRQFVTDVSNLARNENGSLLIRGDKTYNDKACTIRTTSVNGKFFYFVSCLPESLLYMPEGMELCQWDGSLPTTKGSIDNKTGTRVSFANTDKKDLKSDRLNDFYGVDDLTNESFMSYAKTLEGLGYQGASAPLGQWISFKDNIFQYTIMGFQSAAMDKDGEYQILETNDYSNSTYGAWKKCSYWEGKSPNGISKSAYNYFLNENKNGKTEDYLATVATEPVIIGSSTQSGVLNEYSAIGKRYDYNNIDTYPTFAIAVELVGATEGIFGNMVDYSTVGASNYSLSDIFDLDEVNNDNYVDDSSGYCWPLEDSYETTSLISSSFEGKILNINNNYVDKNTGETVTSMTFEVTGRGEDTSSDVSIGTKVTLKNVKPLLPEGATFKSNQILAHNLNDYSYLDIGFDNASATTSANAFLFFKMSTAISINPQQTKEDASGNISNVLAMFDGKIVDRTESSLLLYNSEDGSSSGGLYCLYEGDNLTTCEYGEGEYVSKGSIIGYAKYDFDSNAINENEVQEAEDLELAESAFKVTVYSDSNYNGVAKIKENFVVNNYENLKIVDIKDDKIVCESKEKVKTYSSDNKVTYLPKAEYVYENISLLTDKKGNSKYEVGDVISAGSYVAKCGQEGKPSLTITYRPQANYIYYKNLLDFFPGRDEFANKSKKIIVTIKDTGVEGDSIIGNNITDSLPIYVGKTTELTAKASPVVFNKEIIKWEEVPVDGNKLLNIVASKDGHNIKITAKKDKIGRTKVKGVFVDKKGNSIGGQDCIFEVAIIKVPSKINITFTDYFLDKNGEEGSKASSMMDVSPFVWNSDKTQICLINPDKLVSKFKKNNSDKYIVDMFKASLNDELSGYNGEEIVRWTLTSHGGAAGLELLDAHNNSINPYNNKSETMNFTGKLLYDGKSVMNNEDQYYTLTATYCNQSIIDDNTLTGVEKIKKYSTSINIHIINPIKKITPKSSAFDDQQSNRVCIYPKIQKTGLKLNDYINWTLKSGNTNIFGPNVVNTISDSIIDVKFEGNNYLEYKNGRIVVKEQYYFTDNANKNLKNGWGSATTVHVTLSGQALRYSSPNKNNINNLKLSFVVIMDYNVDRIVLTNAKKSNVKQSNIGVYTSIEDDRKNGYNKNGKYHSYYTAFATEGNNITLKAKVTDKDGDKINGFTLALLKNNVSEFSDLNVVITNNEVNISLINDIKKVKSYKLTFEYGEFAEMEVEVVFVPVAYVLHNEYPKYGGIGSAWQALRDSKDEYVNKKHIELIANGNAKKSFNVITPNTNSIYSAHLPLSVNSGCTQKSGCTSLGDYEGIFSKFKIKYNKNNKIAYDNQYTRVPATSGKITDDYAIYLDLSPSAIKSYCFGKTKKNALFTFDITFYDLTDYEGYNFKYTSSMTITVIPQE